MVKDFAPDEGSYVVTLFFVLLIAIGEFTILKLSSILASYKVEIKVLAICASIITLSFLVPEPFGDIIAIPTVLAILYKYNSNKRLFIMSGISMALSWVFLYILLIPLSMYLYYLMAIALH